MKKIPLTQGKFAIVDDEDFDRVSMYKWCLSNGRNTNYASTYIKGSNRNGKRLYIRMHRLVMDTPEGKVTDHINGNGLDNRKGNLRICITKENARNHMIKSTNKSGVTGVFWATQMGKWSAQITVNYKAKHLGYFTDIADAIYSRKKAEEVFFGEFASQS